MNPREKKEYEFVLDFAQKNPSASRHTILQAMNNAKLRPAPSVVDKVLRERNLEASRIRKEEYAEKEEARPRRTPVVKPLTAKLPPLPPVVPIRPIPTTTINKLPVTADGDINFEAAIDASFGPGKPAATTPPPPPPPPPVVAAPPPPPPPAPAPTVVKTPPAQTPEQLAVSEVVKQMRGIMKQYNMATLMLMIDASDETVRPKVEVSLKHRPDTSFTVDVD